MKHRKIIMLLLSGFLLIGIFIPTQSAKAEAYKKIDQFYDYDSVATINGTWGANLYINNDSHKEFDRILPKDTQWQIFGYTKRKDGFYYWAGGDQWIQANQAIVHVDNKSDAILNVVAKYGDSNNPDTWWLSDHISNGYWGTDYWRVKEMTIIGVSYIYQYVVYPDGSSYRLDNSDNPM
ncbi:hypothetical protein FC83_GL002712 [Agrilactobacillus composti DSM 18527 = JCM 14202]|uniref:Surface layer protein A domain-containing protein n=1 Tax=Agrilactobacillus composti DSM 18527 = JCM 14202 TaxID=1423734 RepID=X0PI88_9LACO|nr:hypothetical protein [Agrilactobacillus composti]KRM36458.1 hypothetical protein FC83_GL002712 [Agrilactobacillus composti DSM 18527 = JCM 14202]GAF41778.1 hypothetical protein JCM14202_3737 [Agrilactobacillus composti DSM 18527 = JCM 14202]